MTAHEPFQELLGAYALDAVDDDERLLVEDHLRTCAACREEVQQHRDVAAHLADGGDAPPPGLWGRIAASLHAEESAGALGQIYPLAGRPPARRWAPALVAAAAVVAAAFGVLGWQVARQSNQVDRLRAAVASVGVNRAAEAALADPRSRVVVLASPNTPVKVTGVLEPDGAGYLVRATALPPLPAGMTYQLWGVVGAKKISLGVLGPSPGVVAFHGPREVSALAITAETGAGVVQPTHDPVVVGAVPT